MKGKSSSVDVPQSGKKNIHAFISDVKSLGNRMLVQSWDFHMGSEDRMACLLGWFGYEMVRVHGSTSSRS
jgi:hypothetical protein